MGLRGLHRTQLYNRIEGCLQASRTGNRTTDHSTEQSYNLQRRAKNCTAKKYSLELLLGELRIRIWTQLF